MPMHFDIRKEGEEILKWEAGIESEFWQNIRVLSREEKTSKAYERTSKDKPPIASRKQIISYLIYPFIFEEAFEEASIETLRTLSRAGTACFDWLIYLDKAIDRPESAETANLLRVCDLQRRFYAILYGLFPADHPFWEDFQALFNEYTRAVYRERILHHQVVREYTFEEMKAIAKGKSALGKAAPVTMGHFFNSQKIASQLCTSIDTFSVGFQIKDDINDWREDLKSDSYSYILTLAIHEGGFYETLVEGEKDISEEIGQYLFFSGLAEEMLEKSLQHFNESASLVEVPCPRWITIIRKEQSKTAALLSSISAMLRTRQAQYMEKQESLSERVSADPRAQRVHEKEKVEQSIKKGNSFLYNHQNEDGSFADFLVKCMVSTVWISGYVGYTLLRSEGITGNVQRCAEWLLDARLKDGGWGYNLVTISDADSTAWALRMLRGIPEAWCKIDSKSLDGLLANQDQATGGICTYPSPEHLYQFKSIAKDTDVQGYCAPHLCVSAVSLELLNELDPEYRAEERESLTAFIHQSQQSDGSWLSHWWDGFNYGTAHAMLALSARGDDSYEDSIARGAAFLTSTVKEDGSWGGGIHPESAPFHTALGLIGLLAQKPDQRDYALIDKAMRWLLNRQSPDGSWWSVPILRVPSANDLEPWNSPMISDHPGMVGTVLRDQSRLFTTATVICAFDLYRSECIEKNRRKPLQKRPRKARKKVVMQESSPHSLSPDAGVKSEIQPDSKKDVKLNINLAIASAINEVYNCSESKYDELIFKLREAYTPFTPLIQRQAFLSKEDFEKTIYSVSRETINIHPQVPDLEKTVRKPLHTIISELDIDIPVELFFYLGDRFIEGIAGFESKRLIIGVPLEYWWYIRSSEPLKYRINRFYPSNPQGVASIAVRLLVRAERARKVGEPETLMDWIASERLSLQAARSIAPNMPWHEHLMMDEKTLSWCKKNRFSIIMEAGPFLGLSYKDSNVPPCFLWPRKTQQTGDFPPALGLFMAGELISYLHREQHVLRPDLAEHIQLSSEEIFTAAGLSIQ